MQMLGVIKNQKAIW